MNASFDIFRLVRYDRNPPPGWIMIDIKDGNRIHSKEKDVYFDDFPFDFSIGYFCLFSLILSSIISIGFAFSTVHNRKQ